MRIRIFIIAMMLLFYSSIYDPVAGANKTMEMLFADFPANIKMTDSKGTHLSFFYDSEEEEKTTGNMKWYYNDWFSTNDDESQWYKVETDEEEMCFQHLGESVMEDFYVTIKGSNNPMIRATISCCEKIHVEKSSLRIEAEKGTDYDYEICFLNKTDNAYYTIKSNSNNDICIINMTHGVSIDKATGKVLITVLKKNKSYTKSIYAFGKEERIKFLDGRITHKSSVSIPYKKTKLITNLYLRPANRGKNMFLTWNRVKGAKSYIVYRYSPVKNEYEKVAIRDSQNANYYNIPEADSAIGYKYKVVAKAKGEGKGKKVCKDSYAVWAVAAGNTKGNVTSITPKKKKVTGKAGKSIRLTAKVATGGRLAAGTTKKVLSKTIRWYSSNQKIAKINKQTGKVKFLRKGKCCIWAKAHNGKNSKKIKVVVK